MPQPTPEDHAAELVTAGPDAPGGPWFVRLHGPEEPPVLLGPYENPANAQADAEKVRGFVASVMGEARKG